MRTILVIGIGAGDPDYLTIQAIKALNRADVLFVVDKGQEKAELIAVRQAICDRYIEQPGYRVVEIEDPERDRTPSSAPGYQAAVAAWRSERASRYAAAIGENLGEDDCGAFLIWGDPSLYDSTIAILDEILATDTGQPEAIQFEYEVIPGISSVQALAARHKIALNRVGEPIRFTTGRRLAETGLTADETVVVMLDARNAFTTLAAAETASTNGADATDGQDGTNGAGDVEIAWGAYLGMAGEILVRGKLSDVAAEIERVRAEARERHGWIMDTYLLRRHAP